MAAEALRTIEGSPAPRVGCSRWSREEAGGRVCASQGPSGANLEYLQRLHQALGPRVDAYRELIEADVIRDPFLGDRTAFLRSLYGDDQSLKSLAAERRRFLLGHADLKPAAPEPE